ncbi:procathepsin L-like [Amblyomma americanum]
MAGAWRMRKPWPGTMDRNPAYYMWMPPTPIMGDGTRPLSSTNPQQYAALYSPPPANLDVRKLPSTVDWRRKGYVTPVKQQGYCSSCWAFSVTGSLEGQHFKKAGKLVSLSEQNLLDCVANYRTCYLGNAWTAFKYIKFNGGIDTEASYLYAARNQQCNFKRDNVGAKVMDYVRLKYGSEDHLKIAVATVGPIAVMINSNFSRASFYSDGVVDDPNCWSDDRHLNHFVLLVGYGVKNGKKYWLSKNR